MVTIFVVIIPLFVGILIVPVCVIEVWQLVSVRDVRLSGMFFIGELKMRCEWDGLGYLRCTYRIVVVCFHVLIDLLK